MSFHTCLDAPVQGPSIVRGLLSYILEFALLLSAVVAATPTENVIAYFQKHSFSNSSRSRENHGVSRLHRVTYKTLSAVYQVCKSLESIV